MSTEKTFTQLVDDLDAADREHAAVTGAPSTDDGFWLALATALDTNTPVALSEEQRANCRKGLQNTTALMAAATAAFKRKWATRDGAATATGE